MTSTDLFECGECPLASPADCLKAGYCAHRDGPKAMLHCMSLTDTAEFRRLCQVAASQGATAIADLLQASLEGPLHHITLFNDEPIEKLADATKLAIEASLAAGEKLDEMRGQLLAALARYLEDCA
ncbi:MAG: hypothetical protein EON59_01365 [Alphaproteobacteria bacterium]|nr:MAG: hypothetical protein EON59_01365 [Alphaproteobacteria bacterium]